MILEPKISIQLVGYYIDNGTRYCVLCDAGNGVRTLRAFDLPFVDYGYYPDVSLPDVTELIVSALVCKEKERERVKQEGRSAEGSATETRPPNSAREGGKLAH